MPGLCLESHAALAVPAQHKAPPASSQVTPQWGEAGQTAWAVLFLRGQSPAPVGTAESSEMTRRSTTRGAAARGALPAALISLTCALMTPWLSPISSLESCLAEVEQAPR